MILSNISNYSIIIWIASAITASFGLIVFIGGSNRSSRMFLATVLSTSIWMASVGAFIASANVEIASIFVKLAYFTGTLTAVTFFSFFLVYPDNKKPDSLVVLLVWIIGIVMGYIYLYTDLSIGEAIPVESFVRYGWKFGPLWFLFYVVLYPLYLVGLILLYRTIGHTSDIRNRRNLMFMGAGVLVFLLPPTLSNVFLPQFGNFDWIWLGPILSMAWVAVVGYSIIRFRQLDVRTFTTEILNVALIIIFFANIFTTLSAGVVGRLLTFIIFLIISYYIIKLGSRIDDLNHNLQSKVQEQTKEIQGLYEVERTARQELERLNEAKDQFIMITQHHLRTPLTQIKWSLEALRDRKDADISFVSDINSTLGSVEQLNHIFANFLNISELQVGKSILKIAPVSLLPLIKETLEEFASHIRNKKLEILYPKEVSRWPQVLVDTNRIKEVLFIIIQNAITYNQEKGRVEIEPRIENGIFVLTVINTGIGIEPSEQKALFTEMFSRSAAAVKAHPLGMGMGLTFARYIMEAHKGSVAVNSEGSGKGARAVIKLPLK